MQKKRGRPKGCESKRKGEGYDTVHLTLEQAKLLLQTKQNRRRLMFSLTLHNGFRAGETASLKWGTLKKVIDNKVSRIRIPKQSKAAADGRPARNKFRDVTLRPEIVAELQKFYRGQADDDFVFPSKKPVDKDAPVKPITVVGMNKVLKEEIEKLGIEVKGNCSFHMLRKTFARQVFEQLTERGLSELEALYRVKDIMGHRSIETTRIYIGLKRMEDAEVIGNLNFYA